MYHKYRMLFHITRVFTMFLMILFIGVCIFFLNGFMEKGAVNSILEDFKKRSVFEKQSEIQGQTVDIYKVIATLDYEDVKERKVFDTEIDSNYYIGSSTDIILTTRNPLRMSNTAIVQDFGAFFSKHFFIGHATMNITDDGSYYVESVGNDDKFSGVRIEENSWIYTEVRYGNDAQTIVGLRLKNTTKEIRDSICERAKSLVGKKYNMNVFVSKRNKYYCTDLITRVLDKEGININYDSLYPTGNDMIISDNTYLIFICERIEDGYFKIYYLSEE